MPTVYNFDNPILPDANAAYYSNKSVDSVSAFSKDAPKALPGQNEPRVLNDMSKIYMPNREDHTAKVVLKTLRATPFNNKFKGNRNTHFKMPTGKPGRQSSEVDFTEILNTIIFFSLIFHYLRYVIL